MGAEPLRRTVARGTTPPPRAAAPGAQSAARAERRARERHLRRRRRDLLEDTAVAFVLTIAALIVTAGLGVIALLEVPLGAVVLGSFVIARRRRRRDA